MREKLLQSIERNKDFTLNFLTKIIEIPTITPPGQNYKDFIDYVVSIVKDWNVSIQVIEVPKDYVKKYFPEYVNYPRYILLIRYGKGKPILHLNGHYDVVPPGHGWTITEPFKPKVVNNRVYGRGSTDMKGGIASIMLLLKSIIDLGIELPGTIEISLTPDEEIGGETGVGYIVENEIVKPNYVIVAEPSGINNIWIGNKGLVWFLIEIYGKEAHGSTPWRGLNAFEAMVKLAYRIMNELKPKIESRISKYEYEVLEGKKATINIGGEVKGGVKTNVVPGYYAFTIDRRVLPEENIENVKKEIIEFIEKVRSEELKDFRIETKIIAESQPVVTEPKSELVMKCKEAIKEVMNIEAKTTVCIGGLDTRYYQAKGIQAITYGPGNPEVAHMADEYVELNDVINVAKVYGVLILKLFKMI